MHLFHLETLIKISVAFLAILYRPTVKVRTDIVEKKGQFAIRKCNVPLQKRTQDKLTTLILSNGKR
ncbi:hypothetical protein T4D_2356 [Trichinella pseudospiralis]|uniref:Uncharacterized protein n=1 Tax=Trichinella pseudospiralis TaxID=6337 RepID=A0A0V1FH39_TRIPS|nr:hypothetical protein T4D_2356 [Trichinella pseudospiralis]